MHDDVQTENGYTAIAHEILEKLAQIKLSPTQYRLILIIWRFTYGFRRKEHKMSLSFLSQATKCDKRHIQRELKELAERRIVNQRQEGIDRIIGFNKHYSQWVGEIDNGNLDNGETDIDEKREGGLIEQTTPPIVQIDNQEIKDLKTNFKTTTTTTEPIKEVVDVVGGDIEFREFEKLRARIIGNLFPSAKEMQAMGIMLSLLPFSQLKVLIEAASKEYKPQYNGDKIRGISYFLPLVQKAAAAIQSRAAPKEQAFNIDTEQSQESQDLTKELMSLIPDWMAKEAIHSG